MEHVELEMLKYPVGRFDSNIDITKLTFWIKTIEKFPALIRSKTEGLSPEELAWTYRPQGWSIRQVVHHCTDSHLNSLVRFKWALTEDAPVIKPYKEDQWVLLGDGLEASLETSFAFLKALHKKWVILLRSMTAEDFKRTFVHPSNQHIFSLYEACAMYAWHCNHHFAHIELALKHKGAWKGM